MTTVTSTRNLWQLVDGSIISDELRDPIFEIIESSPSTLRLVAGNASVKLVSESDHHIAFSLASGSTLVYKFELHRNATKKKLSRVFLKTLTKSYSGLLLHNATDYALMQYLIKENGELVLESQEKWSCGMKNSK